MRLAHIDPQLTWFAGPLAAGPSRAGLQVTFHEWGTGPADTQIHGVDG